MSVNEAARKYGVDVATIWAWVSSGYAIQGDTVLVADERDGTGAWVIREEPAAQR